MDPTYLQCDTCQERSSVSLNLSTKHDPDESQLVRSTSVVVGYCFDCEEHLCQDCFDQHRVPKPCRNHNIMNLSDPEFEIHKEKITDLENNICNVINEKCPCPAQHNMEFYCVSHKESFCVYCYVEKHIKCEVIQLRSLKKDILYDEHAEQCFSQILETNTTLEKMELQIEENCIKVTENRSDCFKAIAAFRKAIEDRLGVLQNEVEQTSEKLHKFSLSTAKELCTEIKTAMALKTSELEGYRHKGQHCKMFMALQTFEDEMKVIKDMLLKANTDMVIKSYEFLPDSQLKLSMFEDVVRFGELEEIVDGSEDDNHVRSKDIKSPVLTKQQVIIFLLVTKAWTTLYQN